MRVELITTGSELLLGQIVNTNSAYMAAKLNNMGFDVLYQTTVGDNYDRMRDVIKNALLRSDIIITTGGLGPTQGDITKYVCAEITGHQMIKHQQSLEQMNIHFVKRNIPMTDNNMRQILVPESSYVLMNHNGIAPGIVQEYNNKYIINLPGPPREMKDMFERELRPFLQNKFGFSQVIQSQVLNTFDIGESLLETKIKDLILAQKNPTLALLVRPSGVIIRVTAKGNDFSDTEKIIEPVKQEIYRRIGEYIYAENDENMETVTGNMLKQKKLTIACAESCTGGLLTSRLTDIQGSSDYVMGSVVSYSNKVKMEQLQVPQEVLQIKGAVSEETAEFMAQGVRKNLHTDIGVGITGIAGPDGGTDDKPVGLVYIAVAGQGKTTVSRNLFSGKRHEIKYRATQKALNMIRLYLTQNMS
ncbi:competence/damage-inducible protein A [Pectinatus brassicae]|uniref:Putative competence-damage inducible protein n=1 Tax=Pectinatus brassicae TaxID=862415 RepID=A0A840UG28_9FIRM|nr:competence/damage-inducible protein A [Pectinatus brassicae]MBB5335959.1 nicotinamide-nucleotide amidase [Pectinatus brassicae]